MEKNMQLTDLQKTYCLGMHPASFLGGKYPFLYVSTKISQFEKERFDRALDAVVRNNTLLHCLFPYATDSAAAYCCCTVSCIRKQSGWKQACWMKKL